MSGSPTAAATHVAALERAPGPAKKVSGRAQASGVGDRCAYPLLVAGWHRRCGLRSRREEQLTVTVKGLNPTPYGEKAHVKVQVGPVKDEKVMDNNSLEADIIFTL